MNAQWKLLITLAGVVATAPAMASDVTYELQGTFSDGGTFSGTFDYDPIANAYQDSSNPLGQFDITTQGGTAGFTDVGVAVGEFVPFEGSGSNRTETQNLSSTPTELVVDHSAEFYYTALMFNWANALNSPSGSSQQAITGSETYSIDIDCPESCPLFERQVVSGFVSPVPLPTSVWLMLSSILGFGALVCSRGNLTSPS